MSRAVTWSLESHERRAADRVAAAGGRLDCPSSATPGSCRRGCPDRRGPLAAADGQAFPRRGLRRGRIYLQSEDGITTVIAPGREFRQLATVASTGRRSRQWRWRSSRSSCAAIVNCIASPCAEPRLAAPRTPDPRTREPANPNPRTPDPRTRDPRTPRTRDRPPRDPRPRDPVIVSTQ